jgi:hypothetical protein
MTEEGRIFDTMTGMSWSSSYNDTYKQCINALWIHCTDAYSIIYLVSEGSLSCSYVPSTGPYPQVRGLEL